MAEARRIFRTAGIPTYETPEQATSAFMQVVEYRRNQIALMQMPPATSRKFTPDKDKARAVVQQALTAGRSMLSEPEAKEVLAAYGIPVVETRVAATPDEAAKIAAAMGFPLAIKILSPDITHKSDVGGVVLDLASAGEVRSAAQAMLNRLTELQPAAKLSGFSVQRMARRPHAYELIIGVATDPVFGPVILFGQGGTAVEVIGDRAIGLPPLNLNLARDLVSRTRIAKQLAGYRDRPPIDHNALCLALTQVSTLVCDLAEIVELDINPLYADENGILALDARIAIAAAAPGAGRLAIRPYPSELEEAITWNETAVMLRPVRPEDEPRHSEFFRALTPEDIHFRFFSMVREPDHTQLARLTQIDYDREMVFVAIARGKDGGDQMLGEARAVFDPDNHSAEFAVMVRSDLTEHGLGTVLLSKLIRYCRERGTALLIGEALADNTRMLALARDLGFATLRESDTNTVQLRLALQRKQ